MNRTPCKPGTIVEWYEIRGTVIKDGLADNKVLVLCSGREEMWTWNRSLCVGPKGICRVISVPTPKSKPRSRNNRLSTVFRNAALFELWDGAPGISTERFQYSCSAVHWAAKRAKLSGARAKKLYAEYFKPYGLSENEGWFPEFDSSYEKSQERRCFALLFMAEIVKDL